MNNQKKYFQIIALFLAITTINSLLLSMEVAETVTWQDNLTNGGIGAAAGMIEVACNQPIIYAKNTIQQGKMPSLNPRIFYRGLGVGIACMAPTTALQFSIEKGLSNIFVGTDPKTIALRAGLAGAFSSVISTP